LAIARLNHDGAFKRSVLGREGQWDDGKLATADLESVELVGNCDHVLLVKCLTAQSLWAGEVCEENQI
jgi:hypothetical protein